MSGSTLRSCCTPREGEVLTRKRYIPVGLHRETFTLAGTKTKKSIPLLKHNLGQNPYPYWHKNREKSTLSGTTRRKLCQIIIIYGNSTMIVVQKLYIDTKFGT